MHWYMDLTFPQFKPTGREKPLEELVKRDQHVARYGLNPEDIQAAYLRIEDRLSSGVPKEVRERLELARTIATYGYFQWRFATVATFWTLSSIEQSVAFKFNEVQPPPYELRRKKEAQLQNMPVWMLMPYFSRGWKMKEHPRINGSFRSLLDWAVFAGLLRHDTPIHYSHIHSVAHHDLLLVKARSIAQAVGRPIPEECTTDDIESFLCSMSEEERRRHLPSQGQLLAEYLPRMRNELAHPGGFNPTFLARTPIEAYLQAVEIMNQFWPPPIPPV